MKQIPENFSKIVAYAMNGGKITINKLGGGGAVNLSQKEFEAYKKAQLLSSELNGSQWQKAVNVLEEADFEVLFA